MGGRKTLEIVEMKTSKKCGLEILIKYVKKEIDGINSIFKIDGFGEERKKEKERR